MKKLTLLSLSFSFLVAAPSFAQTPNPSVDSDADGINDALDVEPCNGAVSARAFVPPGQVYGMILFEDNWPSQGDFDFNDAVVAYHQVLEIDSNGRMTGLKLDLDVVAVGALEDNGLAVRFPTAPSNVQSMSLVQNGAVTSIPTPTTWTGESQAVVTLAPSLHALFDAVGTYVNTEPGQPAHPYVHITLNVSFTPAAVSTRDALFDIFLFNTSRGTEVHLPQYGGTSQMNQALVGTLDDDPNRNFTTGGGIPFALAFPQVVSYPAERVSIDRLYPGIVQFGQSGGTQNQNFYTNPVVSMRYVDQYNLSPLVAAMEADRSCFSPDPGVCGAAQGTGHVSSPPQADLCQVGTPSAVTDGGVGNDFSWSCQGVYSAATPCAAPHWACAPGTTRGCTPSNGANGIQVCSGSGTSWGGCSFTSCQSGYYQSGNSCIPQICSPGSTRTCSVPNGTGTQTCNVNGTDYNSCTAVSCSSGYQVSGGNCVQSTSGTRLQPGNTSLTISYGGVQIRCLRWSGNYCTDLRMYTSQGTFTNACINQIRTAEAFCYFATGGRSWTVVNRTTGTCGYGPYFGTNRDGCGDFRLTGASTSQGSQGSTYFEGSSRQTSCGGIDAVWCQW